MGDNQSKVMVISTKVLDNQWINAKGKEKNPSIRLGFFLLYQED